MGHRVACKYAVKFLWALLATFVFPGFAKARPALVPFPPNLAFGQIDVTRSEIAALRDRIYRIGPAHRLVGLDPDAFRPFVNADLILTDANHEKLVLVFAGVVPSTPSRDILASKNGVWVFNTVSEQIPLSFIFSKFTTTEVWSLLRSIDERRTAIHWPLIHLMMGPGADASETATGSNSGTSDTSSVGHLGTHALNAIVNCMAGSGELAGPFLDRLPGKTDGPASFYEKLNSAVKNSNFGYLVRPVWVASSYLSSARARSGGRHTLADCGHKAEACIEENMIRVQGILDTVQEFLKSLGTRARSWLVRRETPEPTGVTPESISKNGCKYLTAAAIAFAGVRSHTARRDIAEAMRLRLRAQAAIQQAKGVIGAQTASALGVGSGPAKQMLPNGSRFITSPEGVTYTTDKLGEPFRFLNLSTDNPQATADLIAKAAHADREKIRAMALAAAKQARISGGNLNAYVEDGMKVFVDFPAPSKTGGVLKPLHGASAPDITGVEMTDVPGLMFAVMDDGAIGISKVSSKARLVGNNCVSDCGLRGITRENGFFLRIDLVKGEPVIAVGQDIEKLQGYNRRTWDAAIDAARALKPKGRIKVDTRRGNRHGGQFYLNEDGILTPS